MLLFKGVFMSVTYMSNMTNAMTKYKTIIWQISCDKTCFLRIRLGKVTYRCQGKLINAFSVGLLLGMLLHFLIVY